MKFPPGYVPGSGVHKASGFGGFGERLLRQHGWEKGEGLGKNKTGRAEAIQVKKKEDSAGVGAYRSLNNSQKWWEGAFDTAVNIINHDESDSDSDSESDVSTADEITVAVRNNDGTLSSAAQHELQIAADLAAQPAWHGGGRFGGREGKLARIRQQEALAAAKLGLACATADLQPAVAPVRVSTKRKTPSSSINNQGAGSTADTAAVTVTVNKIKGSKKRKQKQGAAESETAAAASSDADVPVTTKKRIIVEPAFTATAPAVPFVQTPAVGWWGAKKFMSAGCLEGIDEQKSKAQSERQQFDEDDQTNLYMAAQNLKTSGKKGLGTKSHIGKIGGAKWEGSKTVFDDDDAKGVAEETETSQGTGTTGCDPPDSIRQEQQADDAVLLGNLPKMKWKKMATAELRKADQQQMRVKLLHSNLIEQASTKHGLSLSKHKQLLKDDLLRTLSSSSQFRTLGKVVSLSKTAAL